MTAPLSVVMPVHNGLPFLDQSITSILGQSFGDFEFIIRDDGSTDGSAEIIRQWAARDARIRPQFGKSRSGPAGSSNRVVAGSKAALVARMDADDVSHPDRLRRQIALLEGDPEAGLVGSLWEGIDDEGRCVRSVDRWRLVRKSPFAPFPHGSVMFRRSLFDRVGGYRAQCDYWEDLDLFLRMAAAARILVIPDALYRHRFARTSTRLSSPRREVETQVDLMLRCVGEYGREGDYEALLREPPLPSARVAPEVLLSLASTILWSGRSPAIVKAMVRRARLRPDPASARSMIWALWASASPLSLRKCLQVLVRLRDRQAGRMLGQAEAFEWRPNRSFVPSNGNRRRP